MSEKAWFGAGCFWGVEHAFRKTEGVKDAVSGFMGGEAANPTYRQVCSGETGHVEVVEVTFDASTVSFEQLLSIFWDVHDPTQLNRQGPDIGEQYRSVIFYNDEPQRVAAEASKTELDTSDRFGTQIVTSVEQAGEFFPAEDYHQRYYEKMGYA
jgi:peptide-methionine (S)-S-oxide reductase